MYALKLELKLNNSERTIMARHAGYARFCYNKARILYLGVMDIKVSRTRKVSLIKKTQHPTSSKNNQNINGVTIYHSAFIKMLSLPSIAP